MAFQFVFNNCVVKCPPDWKKKGEGEKYFLLTILNKGCLLIIGSDESESKSETLIKFFVLEKVLGRERLDG